MVSSKTGDMGVTSRVLIFLRTIQATPQTGHPARWARKRRCLLNRGGEGRRIRGMSPTPPTTRADGRDESRRRVINNGSIT